MGIAKTITIAGETITVRELTVQDIYDLSSDNGKNSLEIVVSLLTTCSTITQEKLMPLAPSELKPFVDLILEVNTPFFVQMADLGMPEIGENLQRLIKSIFSIAFLR